MPALVPPEDVEQQMLAQWLDLRRVLWCHVPNGGMRAWKTAALLKKQGVKSGVPDVLIFSPPAAKMPPGHAFRGIALELKRQKGGRLSPAQQVWLDALSGVGWLVRVCPGAQDAIQFLRSLGY